MLVLDTDVQFHWALVAAKVPNDIAEKDLL